MNNEEILVVSQEINNYADKIKTRGEDRPYHDIRSLLQNNCGDAYNELFVINNDMQMCSNGTGLLFDATSSFLKKIAKQMEDMDSQISQEVKNI